MDPTSKVDGGTSIHTVIIFTSQMEALAESVDGFVLVVGYRQEMIRERFGSSWHQINGDGKG